MPLGAWCTRHKDTISAFGVAVATVGFIVAGVGLTFTAIQVETTGKTLQATNAYQIQKDARDLAGNLSGESLDAVGATPIKLREYLSEYTPDSFSKYDKSAAPKLAEIFNFYLAVYRQYENSGIAPQFASAFGRDFCDFFKLPGATHYWQLRSESNDPPDHEMQGMKNAWCS